MDLLFLAAKAIVVAFFLIMFLRGNKLYWGIGLLTVTTAILLDTLLGTFGREQLLVDLGFFFYVISGALFAGAAVWLYGLLRPLTAANYPEEAPQPAAASNHGKISVDANATKNDDETIYDRQMLYEQIRYRLGPSEIQDLIFDVDINENDVFVYKQDIDQVIRSIVSLANDKGKGGDLALAVERILTPISADKLPRLERLSVDSPPTVLRHFLLANYSLDQLEGMANELEIDWETIPGDSKNSKVRSFLLYLYRRNRLAELIEIMQRPVAPESAPSA